MSSTSEFVSVLPDYSTFPPVTQGLIDIMLNRGAVHIWGSLMTEHVDSVMFGIKTSDRIPTICASFSVALRRVIGLVRSDIQKSDCFGSMASMETRDGGLGVIIKVQCSAMSFEVCMYTESDWKEKAPKTIFLEYPNRDVWMLKDLSTRPTDRELIDINMTRVFSNPNQETHHLSMMQILEALKEAPTSEPVIDINIHTEKSCWWGVHVLERFFHDFSENHRLIVGSKDNGFVLNITFHTKDGGKISRKFPACLEIQHEASNINPEWFHRGYVKINPRTFIGNSVSTLPIQDPVRDAQGASSSPSLVAMLSGTCRLTLSSLMPSSNAWVMNSYPSKF